jgi:hypothetical protein
MSLSRQTVTSLIDLIENKLSYMTVQDREDLREKVSLQKAMCELSVLAGASMDDDSLSDMPRRGRRRRFAETGTGSYA